MQPRKVGVQKGLQTLLGLTWVYSSLYDANFLETGTDVKEERLQYPSGGVGQDLLRSYGYDGANRLTNYSEPGKSQGFGYDAFGNDAFGNVWQTSASGVPSLRQTGSSWYLLMDGTVRNRLSGTVYDAAGDQTQLSIGAGGTNATYDGEGRIVQVDAGGTTVVTYDDAHFELAVTPVRAGNYRQAIEEFHATKHLDRAYAYRYFYNLADAHFHLGDIAQARLLIDRGRTETHNPEELAALDRLRQLLDRAK